jgi:hypothetical protein
MAEKPAEAGSDGSAAPAVHQLKLVAVRESAEADYGNAKLGRGSNVAAGWPGHAWMLAVAKIC